MKIFKTYPSHAVTVALAAVAIAYMYNDFGLDPRILLRVGWRTGWLPKKIMKLYAHPTDPSVPSFYYPAFFMSTDWYQGEVLNWVPRKNDVVVATFPKSGTHLMSQLITQTVEGGNSEFGNIHHAVALIEGEMLSSTKCGDDPNLLTVANYREKMEADGGNRRGVLITHLPVSAIAKPDTGAKTIVMIRDPLDTLASLRSMLSKVMGPGAPTMEEVFEYMFRDIAGGWAEYNLQWWEEAKRRPDDVLILFYEEALVNLTDTVVRASEFLGEPTDPDVVETIRYKSTMEYMKSKKETFDPPLCSLPIWQRHQGGGTMVNKGKAGAGKKMASQELQDEVRKYVRESLAGTDFPFDRFHSLS